MSTKDNSYSQITKRLRSKYNAAFFQNNSSGQVNLIDSPTGDSSNPWLNSLVTGRKNVINTSDLGQRNVDASCVCAATPAPAPATVYDAILLMEGGSLYVATTLGKLFKADNPDANTLTKAYYVSLSSFTYFRTYILQVGTDNVYVVGSPDLVDSVAQVIVRDKTTGASVATLEFNSGSLDTILIVTGLNEIADGSNNYLYVSYLTISILGSVNSYIGIYDMANYTTIGAAVDLTNQINFASPPVLGTATIGNVIKVGTDYYAFTNVIKSVSGTTLIYNLQLTKWSSYDLSTIAAGVNTISNAEINTTVDLDVAFAQNIRPISYNDSTATPIIAIPHVIYGGTTSPPTQGLVMVQVDINSFVSGNIIGLDNTITPYHVSSPFKVGSYLYCSAGDATTNDNSIYGCDYDYASTNSFKSSTASALNASSYSITNDGTQYIYRVIKVNDTTYNLEKYDGSAGGTSGTITALQTSNPYPNLEISIPQHINIIYNSNLYANSADGFISKIKLDDLLFDSNVTISIYM